jgi:hypothetical protein
MPREPQHGDSKDKKDARKKTRHVLPFSEIWRVGYLLRKTPSRPFFFCLPNLLPPPFPITSAVASYTPAPDCCRPSLRPSHSLHAHHTHYTYTPARRYYTAHSALPPVGTSQPHPPHHSTHPAHNLSEGPHSPPFSGCAQGFSHNRRPPR